MNSEKPKSTLGPIYTPLNVSYGRQAATPVTWFSGDFAGWADAEKASNGYNAPAILEKVRASALKAKRGEAAFERDAVAFRNPEIRWPVAACLLMASQQTEGNLHVCDFGGSLASTYYQHRSVLKVIAGLKWSIVEQPHYVACGNREFSDDVLHFYESIDDAAKRARIDVVLFSGSLQYLAEPQTILSLLPKIGIRRILIDRLPMVGRDRDLIQVQHVREPIYNATYPHRAFAREPFLNFVKQLGYSAELTFASDDGPNYCGFLLS